MLKQVRQMGSRSGLRTGLRIAAKRFQGVAFVLSAVALLACALSADAQPAPLRIAAAADLQPVLPAVLEQFHKTTGIEAQASYQASATLTAQIQNGAPFDVFLSADLGYPKRLIDSGAATGAATNPGIPLIYARGTLVLWTRRDSRWPNPSLATLSDPSLQRLAIANPERAPYGRAAMAALTSLKLAEALRPKLATAENISQAAQFAETGNADAGLISLTSAMTAHLQSIGTYFVIPKELYPPIEQGAALVKNSSQQQNARKFLDFLLSSPIQQLLAKSGLTPVK